MLANDRLVKKVVFGATINFVGARKTIAASRDGKISDRVGDLLLNTLLLALRHAANVPTFTVAHKLVDDIASMMGRYLVHLRTVESCLLDAKIANNNV